jgi:two-component system sensor histidine kinase VicK
MAIEMSKDTHGSSYVEALFESVGTGIVATDKNGHITRVNNAALDMFGYDYGEILHKRFINLIVPVHEDGTPIDVIDMPIAKAFLTGQSITERAMYRKKNGHLMSAQVTISPIRQQGKPTGAIAVFRDLTIEAESERMKSGFISLASHQLRTPLSAINIYARMLQEGFAGELTNQQGAFIDTILSSAKRMNELINMLLNITRIEAGNISIDVHPVKLDQLVAEVIEEIEPSLTERSLSLERNIEHGLRAISTDNLLVHEVFANFLSNAIKYTPQGGRISVTLKSTKYNAMFSVSDTGYGIPSAAQKQIFTKFFRAKNILEQDTNGTGLGLYLTKMIAESLGGEVWFESVEGKGSTFFFTLPKRGSIARRSNFRLEA